MGIWTQLAKIEMRTDKNMDKIVARISPLLSCFSGVLEIRACAHAKKLTTTSEGSFEPESMTIVRGMQHLSYAPADEKLWKLSR